LIKQKESKKLSNIRKIFIKFGRDWIHKYFNTRYLRFE
jgi:hypothetical protein